jgi:hypothetical protein
MGCLFQMIFPINACWGHGFESLNYVTPAKGGWLRFSRSRRVAKPSERNALSRPFDLFARRLVTAIR